jgi:hypothetical protein
MPVSQAVEKARAYTAVLNAELALKTGSAICQLNSSWSASRAACIPG